MIESFENSWLEFDLLLREKKGVDELLLKKILRQMKEIAIYYKGESSIPKSLGSIFVDIYSATESNAHIYQDADLKQRILEVADELASHAREICEQ